MITGVDVLKMVGLKRASMTASVSLLTGRTARLYPAEDEVDVDVVDEFRLRVGLLAVLRGASSLGGGRAGSFLPKRR